MNTFRALIFIENTVAQYEISRNEDIYTATLLRQQAHVYLPSELLLWKENGQWRSSHLLKDHAMYQFGYKIDNHMLSSSIEGIKEFAA